MFVVDTNIHVYAADCDAPEHEKCRSLLQAWREQSSPWYLTWGIIYEFLRVASHPSVCRTPLSGRDAWAFVQAVLAAPSVRMLVETEHHGRVVSEVFAELPDIKGNLVFDAHTAVLMREHGLKTIYTRDTDFNRFAFLDVVDPIQGIRRTTGSR